MLIAALCIWLGLVYLACCVVGFNGDDHEGGGDA